MEFLSDSKRSIVALPPNNMTGLLIKSTGNSYIVRSDDNRLLTCHVKGNFRIRGIRSTNPVAVGDHVVVEQQTDGTNWITDIADRKNYIIRRSTNLSKQSHILAANLDLVALIVTVNHPVTSPVFIDRFLATAEAYNVPACLIFNKTDLLNEEEQHQLAALRNLYESIGYPTFAISAKQMKVAGGLQANNELLAVLKNKVVLLSGNSGVGKSTFLNAVVGKECARTAEISTAHNKGMHTTTFSEMYEVTLPVSNDMADNTADKDNAADTAVSMVRIIDTPGIKGFGTLDMQREEVSHYFKEIFPIAQDCRFSNCTHTGEPGCAVLTALQEGRIAPSRFDSYLSILGDTTEEKYR